MRQKQARPAPRKISQGERDKTKYFGYLKANFT